MSSDTSRPLIGVLALQGDVREHLEVLRGEGADAVPVRRPEELADRLLDAPPDQTTVGGLDVTVRRNAFGRQVDSFESEIELTGVDGGPLHAVFIRAPWVEQAGEGVEVLGRVVGGPADGKIVAVRQGSLVATSFHPELTGDRRVHALFVDMVREAVRSHLAERTGAAPNEEDL